MGMASVVVAFFAAATFTFMPQTGSIAGSGGLVHACHIYPTGVWFEAWTRRIRNPSSPAYGRIEGQVRGVARMVEEDRYCIDVITQVRAVRAALDKVEQEILHDHLQHCVAHAFHAGNERERQTKIEELMEVLDRRR